MTEKETLRLLLGIYAKKPIGALKEWHKIKLLLVQASMIDEDGGELTIFGKRFLRNKL